MKKSLSVLLSAALALGAFASVASAADPATAQEKFDALKAKGVFAGINGEAALDQKMTRAQFARVLGLLKGVNVDAEPTVQTFTDVAKTAWYYQEVEAAVAAKLLVGVGGGKFNPGGDVTVQEIAVALAAALGLEPVKDAKVEGAADWAAGSIQALINNGINLPTTYTAAASREILVNASYEAAVKLGVYAPAKVSVASAKATDVKSVEVSLDKAVDTDKATVTLKKGAATVATTTKWSDDKKTATLTLTSAKISEGTYTVTLGGVAEDTVAKASSEFTAEDETVKSIEFVSANDTIAFSTKAKLKLNPLNQYGKTASFNASSYVVNANTSSASLKKDTDGMLVATINTTTGGVIQGVSQIPVYVYFDNNRAVAQKTFKLGTTPFATTMKVGDVKYSNGKDVLSVEDEVATVPLEILDQYGNPITPEQGASVNINAFVTPYNQALTYDYSDTSGDEYKVKVKIATNNDVTKAIEKAATYTLTVYAGSANGTAQIKVGPAKVAMSVKVAEADLLAAGDTNKYVSLEVYDADGNALTPQEIADNYSRINVTVSGAVATNAIVRTGSHKGQIKIDTVPNSPNGYVFVTATIATVNANSHSNKQFKIEPARVPDHIEIDTASAVKAVLGATSDFKLLVKDQYGETLTTPAIAPAASYRVEARLLNGAGVNTTVSTDYNGNGTADAGETISNNVAWTNLALQPSGGVNNFTNFNKKYTFNTVSADRGTARFEAQLVRTDVSGTAILSTKYLTLESIAPTSNLVYSLNDLGTVFGTTDAPTAYGLTGAELATDGPFAKSVELTVKDPAGNKVAVPSGLIKALYSSNVNVVRVTEDAGTPDTDAIVGQKAGTASVTASVYAVDGTTKALTANVTVKADPIAVSKIEAEDEITLGGVTVFDGANGILDKANLKVTTQYGNEFKQDWGTPPVAPTNSALAYNNILGVSFTISDVVKSNTAAGGVTINYMGGTTNPQSLTISANVVGFTLNVVSADGKVVKSIQVTV